MLEGVLSSDLNFTCKYCGLSFKDEETEAQITYLASVTCLFSGRSESGIPASGVTVRALNSVPGLVQRGHDTLLSFLSFLGFLEASQYLSYL